MTINNQTSSVNSTAKNLFYSDIPFGSDYVIYTSADNEYTMYLRRVGHSTFDKYVVRRFSNSSNYHWQVLTEGEETDLTEVSVQNPYYAYSNMPMQGVAETLPCMGYVNSMMLIVLACSAILTVVFGGIRLWLRK